MFSSCQVLPSREINVNETVIVNCSILSCVDDVVVDYVFVNDDDDQTVVVNDVSASCYVAEIVVGANCCVVVVKNVASVAVLVPTQEPQ